VIDIDIAAHTFAGPNDIYRQTHLVGVFGDRVGRVEPLHVLEGVQTRQIHFLFQII
jgi:hypothetical protein